MTDRPLRVRRWECAAQASARLCAQPFPEPCVARVLTHLRSIRLWQGRGGAGMGRGGGGGSRGCARAVCLRGSLLEQGGRRRRARALSEEEEEHKRGGRESTAPPSTCSPRNRARRRAREPDKERRGERERQGEGEGGRETRREERREGRLGEGAGMGGAGEGFARPPGRCRARALRPQPGPSHPQVPLRQRRQQPSP